RYPRTSHELLHSRLVSVRLLQILAWAGTQTLRIYADDLANTFCGQSPFAQEVGPGAREINNGRWFTNGRLATVQVNCDGFSELLLGSNSRGRWRMAGDIRRRNRHRPNFTQQLNSNRMQRHTQHHSAARIPQIPRQ